MRMLSFFVVLTLTTPVLAQNTSAVDDAKAMFAKAITDFNAGDYDAYLSSIADDFEGYTGVFTPLRFEGKAAWSNFIKGLGNYASVTYDQRQPDYRSYGDNTVLCNAYFVFTTVASDGTVETQTGRETTVLIKMNGTWKIANYHFSAIF